MNIYITTPLRNPQKGSPEIGPLEVRETWNVTEQEIQNFGGFPAYVDTLRLVGFVLLDWNLYAETKVAYFAPVLRQSSRAF